MQLAFLWVCLCGITFAEIAEISFFTIQDHILSPVECKEIISQVQKPITYISTNSLWKTWDDRLFKIFNQAANTYTISLETNKIYLPEIKSDTGYVLFHLTEENTTVPLYSHDVGNQIQFAMYLFLNDNFAGGEWSFILHDKHEFVPSCGKLLIVPTGYAFAYSINKIRIGNQYFIKTLFKT